MADQKQPAKKPAAKKEPARRKPRAKAKAAPKPAPKPKPIGLMYMGPSCPAWGLVSARIYPSHYDGDRLLPVVPDQARPIFERQPWVRNLFVHPSRIAAVSRASRGGSSVVSSLSAKLAALYREEYPR